MLSAAPRAASPAMFLGASPARVASWGFQSCSRCSADEPTARAGGGRDAARERSAPRASPTATGRPSSSTTASAALETTYVPSPRRRLVDRDSICRFRDRSFGRWRAARTDGHTRSPRRDPRQPCDTSELPSRSSCCPVAATSAARAQAPGLHRRTCSPGPPQAPLAQRRRRTREAFEHCAGGVPVRPAAARFRGFSSGSHSPARSSGCRCRAHRFPVGSAPRMGRPGADGRIGENLDHSRQPDPRGADTRRHDCGQSVRPERANPGLHARRSRRLFAVGPFRRVGG